MSGVAVATGAARDAAGFDEFVASRGDALWRSAWLLTGDAHLAEDLVQTALGKSFTAYDRVSRDGSFEAYVRRVLFTTYVAWWRRRWNGERPTEVLPETVAAESDRPGSRHQRRHGQEPDCPRSRGPSRLSARLVRGGVMSDDRLRDALSGLVPEPPATPERAAGARARAASGRRGRIAAGVATAAVAAAIVVPFALTGGADRADQSPLPVTTSTPTPAAGAFVCPPPPADQAVGGPLAGPDTLPDGAIAAGLCFEGGLPWQAPEDSLSTGLQQIVDLINHLPVQPPPGGCPADLGPTWALLFKYPGGGTQLVRGRSYGCGGVDVGGVTRGDRETGDDPLRMFQDLLWEQRILSRAPQIPVKAPACDHAFFEDGPGLTMMTWPSPLQLSRGAVCWRYATHSQQPMNSSELSRDDLDILVEDFNAHASDGNPPNQSCTQVVTVAIDGITPWNDELRMDSSCGYFYIYDGEKSRWWKPDQQSQAILDRVISSNPLEIPLPSADTAPDEVVNAWVDLFDNDRPERASQLWVGDEPSLVGVDRIELKVDGVSTVDPAPGTAASAYKNVMSVTALYLEVPADADYRERAFTLVRNSSDEPWRILSYSDGN